MPKLLDLRLTGRSLAFRLVTAILLGAVILLILSYIPANLPALLSPHIPLKMRPAVNALLSALIDPALPSIGLIITLLISLSILLRGSKVYGPLQIMLGLSFTAYIYLLFQGGLIDITIPEGIIPTLYGTVRLQLSTLMVLFILPGLLTALKGIIITIAKPKQ